MISQDILNCLPYPIATIYADLQDEGASPHVKREAVYFTAYQLMRTVSLTLVGQYLHQEPPADAPYKAMHSLSRAVAGVRAPHFSDWITLLNTLHRVDASLRLDFFGGSFPGAMESMRANRVEIPRHYLLDAGGREQGLTWLEALLALRNSTDHGGLSREEDCLAAIQVFGPILDQLLTTFAFLGDYQLLALRSTLDQDPPRVQLLQGPQPPEFAHIPSQGGELEDDLYLAFELSPVVMRAPGGRVQELFPLFHAHIEGEPLYYYDGHFLLERDQMCRRTIYYLGSSGRVPLDDAEAAAIVLPPASPDAGEQLRKLLDARQVPWQLRREQVAPWTLRDSVNDYARRTLADLMGVKYLPACYLDRPSLSGPLWQVATAEEAPHPAFLLSGPAGSGKTALLCDLVRRHLEQEEDHLLLYLRGDGLQAELPGGNLLLTNVLHKTGLNPDEFASFAELLALLAARSKQDRLVGRRLVIVLDAINEAPFASQLLGEALQLVALTREHPWLRVILSAREEFLAIWRGRRGQLETSPFYPLVELFAPPPLPPERAPRPEEPPAWLLPPFSPSAAETVYRRYQAVKASGGHVPACSTDWQQLPPPRMRIRGTNDCPRQGISEWQIAPPHIGGGRRSWFGERCGNLSRERSTRYGYCAVAHQFGTHAIRRRISTERHR